MPKKKKVKNYEDYLKDAGYTPIQIRRIKTGRWTDITNDTLLPGATLVSKTGERGSTPRRCADIHR